MDETTPMVEYGVGETEVREYVTIALPGVPRVGDVGVTEGALFEVRGFTWHDTWMSLMVLDTTYVY